MKLLSFILALAIAKGVYSNNYEKEGCDADNCARAVTGTRPGKVPDVTSRMADCSSFMQITVTPATSTVTKTSTVTTTTTAIGQVVKREVLEARQVTVQPSSVPAYASACKSPARYSSACSCWGITATTTIAPTPITTTTTTVTVTATVTACPTDTTKCGSVCCKTGDICMNGACSVPSCQGKVCGQFVNCSPGGSLDCQCYTTSDGTGFCAHNQPCTGLADCTTSNDCPAASICAVNSCCVRNVCLPATCGNPARIFKLAKKKDGDGCTSGTPCV